MSSAGFWARTLERRLVLLPSRGRAMSKYSSHNKASIGILTREDCMFQSHAPEARERQIREARHRIDDQRACLQRMIVQGCPTQSADDLLSRLHEALRQLRGH